MSQITCLDLIGQFSTSHQAHQNADAMYYYVSKRYLWQDMRKDIKEYAKTCFQCQQRGSMRQNNQSERYYQQTSLKDGE